MIEFSVDLPNRPGQLAQLARELGEARINIRALSALTIGDQGTVRLVVDDEAAARRVLADSGIGYAERRIVSATLRDKPGALAELADALAANGTNIEALYLLSSNGQEMKFAIAVDDPEYVGNGTAV
ncbi:MAG: ACT domain-containing protein [Actinobacteria bacterium]|nr:MAG: ACT domain-containing protein [Actinomycetota bacterium]